MFNKKLLVIKSECYSQHQIEQLAQKGIQTTNLNLLQFTYKQFEIDQDINYDYVLFHSINGVQSYIQCQTKCQTKNYLVVGNKTKEKIEKELGCDSIQVFNNQNELTMYLLSQNQQFNLLYIIGNLSEIGKELQNKHQITIIEGYQTLSNNVQEKQNLDFREFDYIVYYSNSNYNQFKQMQMELKENVLHIFIGQKCSQGHNEKNLKILPVPTFECLLECL
ncbi:unnamed protein product [Paramecium pentaurelia]|uniref:Tetrapyrrole biosynthesis uroporphyrinogen III synthase domain-containing protein n=1 Tax=Paramecium pentaurelia TaxID=43138 RepID=A0A8S1U046_9CILI|nr:unnamed protein product [Paramecium pentaurelia]